MEVTNLSRLEFVNSRGKIGKWSAFLSRSLWVPHTPCMAAPLFGQALLMYFILFHSPLTKNTKNKQDTKKEGKKKGTRKDRGSCVDSLLARETWKMDEGSFHS